MRRPNAVTICALLAVILSIPSAMRIPLMINFLDPEVRAMSPLAIEELRIKGIWMVNADLKSITKEGGKTCFNWEHQYESRSMTKTVEFITTCL